MGLRRSLSAGLAGSAVAIVTGFMVTSGAVVILVSSARNPYRAEADWKIGASLVVTGLTILLLGVVGSFLSVLYHLFANGDRVKPVRLEEEDLGLENRPGTSTSPMDPNKMEPSAPPASPWQGGVITPQIPMWPMTHSIGHEAMIMGVSPDMTSHSAPPIMTQTPPPPPPTWPSPLPPDALQLAYQWAMYFHPYLPHDHAPPPDWTHFQARDPATAASLAAGINTNQSSASAGNVDFSWANETHLKTSA